MFNPAIIQPSWLARQGLIKDSEAESATINLIQQNVSVFASSWLEVRVIQDRFEMISEQEAYFPPLRDIVKGVFEILSHTPVSAIGLNHKYHFRLENETLKNNIGDALAPKEFWNDQMVDPRMRTLIMEEVRNEGPRGYRRVKVGPSPRIKEVGDYGVLVDINDHYQASDGENEGAADIVTEVLSNYWDSSSEQGERIAKKIMGLMKNEE